MRRCISSPPGAVFQARLLDNQEVANTERCVFGKLSVRCFQRRASCTDTTPAVEISSTEIGPGVCDRHRRIRYTPASHTSTSYQVRHFFQSKAADPRSRQKNASVLPSFLPVPRIQHASIGDRRSQTTHCGSVSFEHRSLRSPFL